MAAQHPPKAFGRLTASLCHTPFAGFAAAIGRWGRGRFIITIVVNYRYFYKGYNLKYKFENYKIEV